MSKAARNDKLSTHVEHAAGIGARAGNVLYAQWSEFCRLRTVVLSHHDTDAIHDLRVASRRLRATLGLFTPFISVKSVKSVSQEIRRVTGALGHVRNIDEARIYVKTLPVELPILDKRLRRLRTQEVKAVTRMLKMLPCRKMDKRLQAAVAEMAVVPSHDNRDQRLLAYLSETSIQRYQMIHALLAPAIIPENVTGRHRLRIAIKKWRYLLEAVGQVCGQDYGAILETLKGYQTLLGTLNDLVEFGILCDRLKLPQEEKKVLKKALLQEAAGCFASFVQVAASQPLQYSFHL